ncbi:hypothetical protein D3C72_1828980 [compost metagenome]
MQFLLQIGAQQAQLLGVLEQQLPGRRGPQRPAAHHQHRAHLCLQRTQALRDGRLRHVQAGGCFFKAALFNHCGKAFQRDRVQVVHGSKGLVLANLMILEEV